MTQMDGPKMSIKNECWALIAAFCGWFYEWQWPGSAMGCSYVYIYMIIYIYIWLHIYMIIYIYTLYISIYIRTIYIICIYIYYIYNENHVQVPQMRFQSVVGCSWTCSLFGHSETRLRPKSPVSLKMPDPFTSASQTLVGFAGFQRKHL